MEQINKDLPKDKEVVDETQKDATEEQPKRQFILREDFEYIENVVGNGAKVGIACLVDTNAIRIRLLVNSPTEGDPSLYVENQINNSDIVSVGMDAIVEVFAREASISLQKEIERIKEEIEPSTEEVTVNEEKSTE